MGRTNCAVTCRWAVSTLFLPMPVWLSAEDSPWACTRTTCMRVLETTELCAECPHWTPDDHRELAPLMSKGDQPAN
jgi:hypothetical protein